MAEPRGDVGQQGDRRAAKDWPIGKGQVAMGSCGVRKQAWIRCRDTAHGVRGLAYHLIHATLTFHPKPCKVLCVFII
ncbi:hypothetical protein BDA96_03G172200 [Sorghum bicolor]|uniref:Uncharacterized protein n=2 Tax=Sorghum bicolor TaxID=4558 RepID=A0A921RD93_SORBI|nr:hypothetical protein BDA96_03G172200 [Sorghum bicolor]KXG32498.1 hypothetical protein SORBI_3003G163000 [Sorghum bicolor]